MNTKSSFYDLRLDSYNGVVGWCKVLGKLPVPGRPTILIKVGQPTKQPTTVIIVAGSRTYFSNYFRGYLLKITQ